jgi:hypothetical protein
MEPLLICARCSDVLKTGDGSFFVVKIEAFADPSGPVVESRQPTAKELRRQLETLVKQMHDVSPHEAMDQVFRRLTLHLCKSCYQIWIENPAGA